MTCVPSDPRFRLLDHIVGWDAANHDGLTGLDDPDGIRLTNTLQGIPPEELDPYIPPPPLAPGCGPCDWYLAPRAAPLSHIKALDGCSNDWRLAWPRGCVPVEFKRAVAIAVDRHRIAVADAGTGRVWVMLLKGAQVVAEIAVDHPRDLSFGPSGEIVVAAEGECTLRRFSFNGRPLGPWPTVLPLTSVTRIAHDRMGRLWLATEIAPNRFVLFSQDTVFDPAFIPRKGVDLAKAFEPTAAVRSGQSGFCLRRGGSKGGPLTLCWNWFGRSIAPECIETMAGRGYATQGQLLTHALDSGMPRCRWHRLIFDAEIPAGTRVSVAVATDEVPTPQQQGVPDPDWEVFPAGRPHPADWQAIPPGLTDALIRCPPGRYLFLRLRLCGDGNATPCVRRIHIDFPRATSADLLPAVFREGEAAGDFTERFLSLFDASLGTVDAAVARFPALIDVAGVQDEVLPWIARFLSVTLDETWDAKMRRRMLKAAPELFRRRGTRWGLEKSIRLAFGLREDEDPAITEHGLERVWGAVASSRQRRPTDARLGHTRLFSRRGARLTLGASPLGRTPVMSYGDPAADPHAVGAFRFTVGLPASVRADQAALARLVEGQKPAHTLAMMRASATTGFLLGSRLLLGIDTLITRPNPHVLGEGCTQLGRNSILGGVPPPGPVLGTRALTNPRPAIPYFSCQE